MTTSTTGRRGFTFIEILFVVIIIGILAAVSFPALRHTFSRLQLDDAAGQMQSLMNYLAQRSVIEGKLIYLYLDPENKTCYAQLKDSTSRIRTYQIPSEISIGSQKKQVNFYPDGSIDPVTLTLTGKDGDSVTLTTEGVFGREEIQTQE